MQQTTLYSEHLGTINYIVQSDIIILIILKIMYEKEPQCYEPSF